MAESKDQVTPRREGFKGWFTRFRERSIVSLIYLCGVSSIIFVFGIFFFVFREG